MGLNNFLAAILGGKFKELNNLYCCRKDYEKEADTKKQIYRTEQLTGLRRITGFGFLLQQKTVLYNLLCLVY